MIEQDEARQAALAFLADLHEQVSLFRRDVRDPTVAEILDRLADRLVSLGAVVTLLPPAGTSASTDSRSGSPARHPDRPGT